MSGKSDIPWTKEQLYKANIKLQSEVKQLQEENTKLKQNIEEQKYTLKLQNEVINENEEVSKSNYERMQKRIEELESFVKAYYHCFLDSRRIHKDMKISLNDQYFMYAKANELLSEPNGARLDDKEVKE